MPIYAMLSFITIAHQQKDEKYQQTKGHDDLTPK